MGRIGGRRLAIAAGIIAAVYTAWPLMAGLQLRQAIRTRDVAALERVVNWPLLRANLKPRLAGAIKDSAAQSGTIGSALKRAVGSIVGGTAVDTLVTPANLGRLLASRAFLLEKFPGTAKPGAAPPKPPAADDPEEVDDPMPPRRLRWAFFESPTRFRVEAAHPKIAPDRIAATLALEGFAWKLIDVEIVKR